VTRSGKYAGTVRRYDTLVRALIDLGSALGLTTVAEGIEHTSQSELLYAKGCQLGQGFKFASHEARPPCDR